MNRQELIYLIPYLLSLALSLGIFSYTWQHRSVRGARVYSWFVAGQTLTILGFILELISPSLETKLLWDRFQWLTDTFLVILPFLIFCVQYSEHKLRHPRLAWGYLLGIPILFTLVLLTDDLHHLLYPNPHLSLDAPFPELKYDFTFVVYGYTLLYVYGANFYGISLLIRRALQPHNEYRLQYWTITIGFLIPIALSILSLFNLYVSPQRDLSPFSLAIGNLVVAWGLFRYGLFDLVPLAREHVLENMTDAIVVVDALNRVVDINQAALAIAGRDSAETIGHPVQEAFAGWPHLVEQVLIADDTTREVSARVRGRELIYELSVSAVRDQRHRLLGRVFVAHDITGRKMLEQRYRQLSEELEQRVRERTEELHESTERYRAVVENQTEFIIRWKPNGLRTFANEAYRRYFGLTPEQAASPSFMPRVAEEDRNAVEGKLSRLLSGISASETDVHRVIKPDGSIGWQEWVDQAIHDSNGQIVEFQSVGRDITARKQAEQALRDSEELHRVTLGSISDAVFVTDENGTFIYICSNVDVIFGYSQTEVLALGNMAKLLGEDLFDPQELDAHREIQNIERQISTKAGDLRVLLVNVKHVSIRGGTVLLTCRDITERKRASQALREKTDELERFFISALDLLCIADTEGYFRRLNPEWGQVLGYQLEDLEGRRFRDLVHPDDQQATLAVMAKLDAQQEVLDFTNRYRCKDGTYRWIEWRAVQHGKLIYASARDITDRKQAEQAVRKSERVLRAAESLGHTGSWEQDLVTSEIFNTEENLRLFFGDDRNKGVYFEDYAEVVHPDDRGFVMRRRAELLEEAGPGDIEYRVVWPDGSVHVIFGRATVVRDESGNPTRVYGTNVDITERKRIESALRESEKRYRDLVEFSPVAMTVHMEGRIVYINPAGARLWGAGTPEEVLGRSPLEFVHPEYHERITERIAQIRAVEQSPPPIEVKNTRLDGQILYTAGTGIPITYEGQPAILSVVLDITERKLAEERLRELTRQLIAAQEAERKRIAQELHDELGQAMTAISLDLGGIEKALPAEASRELRERLIDARSMADAVDEQISEMALDLRPSLLDDLGLLPALQWYLNRYSQRTGIEVATNFEGLQSRLPDEVETTLYRVIQEALTNIARHAQAGKVRISLDRSAAAVTASIQDNGRGFDVDGAQGPLASPGSMGLPGIKDRVSTLGGTVDIHSERGEGTRIQIELPI